MNKTLVMGVVVLSLALGGCVGIGIDMLSEEIRSQQGPHATCNWPAHGPRVWVPEHTVMVRETPVVMEGRWRCQSWRSHVESAPPA